MAAMSLLINGLTVTQMTSVQLKAADQNTEEAYTNGVWT